MTIDEIKAVVNSEVEEGVEDTRMETVYSEIADRDNKISELEGSIAELTDKVSSLVETNSKLAETIKYVEPEKEEEEEKEPEVEFADFSTILKEED